MAKLAEQFVILKVSKAVSSSDSDNLEVLTDELVETIRGVIQELLSETDGGPGCIVDIEKAE